MKHTGKVFPFQFQEHHHFQPESFNTEYNGKFYFEATPAEFDSD